MLDWNPSLYRRYEDERTRPAEELLARVPAALQVRHAVDLGCGPGNSTELLVRRYPGAAVEGIDNSEAMLESARARLAECRFTAADIATWQPAQPADLVYANASLQWLPSHESLVPRLFDALAPGGVLAIQMPDNREEPTHRLMREVAAEAPFAAVLGDAASRRTRILPLAAYYDLLAPLAGHIDVWHTVYQHRMPNAEAIVEWVRGTGLKPFVESLPPELQASYLAEYTRRVTEAYVPRADGQRLLAFPRMFIVAQREP